MSTRAVIARQTSDGWEGVYHHFDGYPTALGRELFDAFHSEYGGDIERFLSEVIEAHPGGWSHFIPAIPADLWDAYREASDPEAFFKKHAIRECYCHSPRLASRDGSYTPDGRITYDPSADGAGDLEWAYCFNFGSMTVFQALPSDVRRLGDSSQVASGDIYQLRPHAWQVIAIVSLRGPEPDWSVLECGRNFERCQHYAWAHLDGSERDRVRSHPHLSKLSMRDYVRARGHS